MVLNDLINVLSAEEFLSYMGRLMWFGDLPNKEKYTDIIDKDFVVSYKNMKSENDVKYAIMLAREVNMYIDMSGLDENSKEYDDLAFLCEMQYANIIRYWFGYRKFKEDKSVILELMRDTFWDYMRGDIDFDEFKKNVTDYNSEYIN